MSIEINLSADEVRDAILFADNIKENFNNENGCFEIIAKHYRPLKLSDSSISITLTDLIKHLRHMNGLRGNTTWITMEDGSARLLQFVKPGDIVMGYNPKTNQLQKSVVIKNIALGETNSCKTYITEGMKQIDTSGDFLVLTKTELCKLSDLETSAKKVFGKDMSEREVIHSWEISTQRSAKMYALLTSNTTFFANDICCAYPENTLKEDFRLCGKEIPENINYIFNKAFSLSKFDQQRFIAISKKAQAEFEDYCKGLKYNYSVETPILEDRYPFLLDENQHQTKYQAYINACGEYNDHFDEFVEWSKGK